MAGTGGRLAGKIYERGGQEAIFSLVADALANPYTARLLLTETARLDKAGKFVCDKRLLKAVRPYQFYVGPRTQVVREGMEEQREIDRIEREGGPFETIYDPKEGVYRRQKVREEPAPIAPEPTITDEEALPGPPTLASRTPPAPSRPIVAGSTLAQARLGFDELAARPPQPLAAAASQGPPPQDRAKTLQDMAALGLNLFEGPITANKGGLASLQRKPRQMVH